MSHPSQPLEVFPPPPGFRSPVTSVHREGTYEFYGPASTSGLTVSASDFILKHCAADKDGLVRALSSFLDDAAAHARQQASSTDQERSTHSTWLCVRITAPTDAWAIPRWHRDGRMFDCMCAAPRPHAKYAMTLLGPPTRMLWPSETVDAAVRKVEAQHSGLGMGENDYSYESEEKERAGLAEALEEIPLVELQTGQVVRFTWGESDAPVHSEPDSSAEARLFLSVMFGSEAELRDMCSIRDEVYGEESTWTSQKSLE
ncbi:hypothetical protein CGRA01v4_12947 [Colletotrichum graminicola]|uniref:Uncharacterized protein n=1 Tax=Colletotrichum graminicola (strain M1.001 / M2 / FGSC 10212) TaxID=645133 RepID=E3QJ39_COLGM|nr:uncharacterized protein GLRG_06021 [Colletotrichum graminicola M1.001]EFQ30877.1 hypothetical protein GLRG_06021 [Colletotrichum graminicola M1.001]WDK21657.1 hypothetical protein CGRA01v4_12947 [Colletotrichum graminicola]